MIGRLVDGIEGVRFNPEGFMSSKLALIGPGNLAHSLVPALQAAGHDLRQVLSRRAETARAFGARFGIAQVGDLHAPLDASVEVVLLTVPDQAIAPLARDLAARATTAPIFVHTSGSTPLSALAPLGPRVGVLYPLQMFTRHRQVNFAELPLFLEGSDAVLATLDPLARSLSRHVHQLDSTARLRMHLGAVIACNFSNYLLQMAEAQLDAQPELDISVYAPLLQEQLRRVFELGPRYTQTGPAIRGDHNTMQQHLALLADQPELAELYRTLSALINPDLRKG